jgi:putative ABC transport system substrate-binding protein
MIGRREFITLLGGAAAAWPVAARAQQPDAPVIGYLYGGSPDIAAAGHRAVQQALSQAGIFEARNIGAEVRAADGHYDRLPALAADLVRRQVSVIVTPGVPPALAAKAATATVPIVFVMGADPLAFGLVGSLNRPGANLTGVATLGVGLGPKHLELLHELIPAATKMALLVNPANPSSGAVISELKGAAPTLGLQLHVLQARTEGDFDTAFVTLRQLGAEALVISNEALFNTRSEDLASLTLRHRVPAIHVSPEFAESGGLMSYGHSISERNRLVGEYVGRILKGEKPGNLPVQQVTKVEFTINLKTAKALGTTFPPTLLGRADRVIE